MLSCFVFEPQRWIARFGWRSLTEKEQLAAFYYWRELGRRMDIKDIPESIDELERFNVAYEREHYRYAPSNYRLAVATRNLFLGWFPPKPLWPVGAPFIHTLMDDRLLDACGLPHPPRWLRRLTEGLVRLRGRFVRLLPERRAPRLITRRKHPTYPDGYRIEELGTLTSEP